MSEAPSPATEFRTPEQEQAQRGRNVPAADELALAEINPLNANLFAENRWQRHFERLRREDPVHFNEIESAGRYWSVTKYDDIKTVSSDWQTFSSAHGITLGFRIGSEARHSSSRARARPSSPRTRRGRRNSARPCGPRSRRAISPSWNRSSGSAPAGCSIRPSRGRDLRLGGHGFDRVDHGDAGDALRLPLRRPTQADALVGHRLRHPRAGRRRRVAGPEARRDDGVRLLLLEALGRAPRATRGRPRLDAGPR